MTERQEIPIVQERFFNKQDKEKLEQAGFIVMDLTISSLDQLGIKIEAFRVPAAVLSEKPEVTQVAFKPDKFLYSYKGTSLTGKKEDIYHFGDEASPYNSQDPFEAEAERKGVSPFELGLQQYQETYVDVLNLENAKVVLGQAVQHGQIAIKYFQETGVNLYDQYYASTSSEEVFLGYDPDFTKSLTIGRLGEIAEQYAVLATLIVAK